MRQVNSKIYDKDYYLHTCLGSELYKKSKGKELTQKWKNILKLIKIKQGDKILDLGCGRGDVCFYLAREGAFVTGVDYSKDAIDLANGALKSMPEQIKRSTHFIKQDAKKINFPKDTFDVVICLDVFEHLYDEELKIVLNNISKILKENGILVVHTETNKIYQDYTHKFYVFPLSTLLIKINKYIFGKSYAGPPKDPRNEFHKMQHVNEPTIFYLRSLFKKNLFEGEITSVIGVLKPVLSWKDLIYNILACAYPFCLFFPLNIFFATEYICIMKNKKASHNLSPSFRIWNNISNLFRLDFSSCVNPPNSISYKKDS
jgi:ubiquinone/menaquinone biosynthesis C-methylase UbiE